LAKLTSQPNTSQPTTSTADETRAQSDQVSLNKPAASRKRRAAQIEVTAEEESRPARRAKKSKVTETPSVVEPQVEQPKRQSRKSNGNNKTPANMASSSDDLVESRRASASRRRQPSPPGTNSEEISLEASQPITAQSRRRSSGRKSSQVNAKDTTASASTPSTSKRAKKVWRKKDATTDTDDPPFDETEKSLLEGGEERIVDNPDDVEMEGANDNDNTKAEEAPPKEASASRLHAHLDEDDPFTSALLSRMAGVGSSSSFTNTLRALGGMMSGMSSKLRRLLESLRSNDPSVQLIALSELSELLLISTEDNLAGFFSPDAFVKELVKILQPNDMGEENPEMLLLACRCIANLMEAIPSSISSVVYGGAVPILCQKLLEIHFIDLAEQALSTLEKISVEYPSSIVREGGLTACLTYLDFFATSTQRTAVTTAANCCRGIPEELFSTVKDVMPILLNVLGSNDQKVVEQAALCVCRIVESFKWQNAKLEQLIDADLLKVILRLLLPGSTNTIGTNIHTQFLKVLGILARASPQLSMDMLRLSVADTIYQILTGVSPPSGSQGIAGQIDKNVVMQALIRSPKDQVFETLNLICELLPSIAEQYMIPREIQIDEYMHKPWSTGGATRSQNAKRVELLAESIDEVQRFATILFPTLMHAYTSTVNLEVRQKVMTAQLKMLSNFSTAILEEALKDIAFASHIASILTQNESPSLASCALQMGEILMKRLGHVYLGQMYREGIIALAKELAARPLRVVKPRTLSNKSTEQPETHIDAQAGPAEITTDDKQEASANKETSEPVLETEKPDEEMTESEPSEDEEMDDDDTVDSHHMTDMLTKRAQRFMETTNNDIHEKAAEEACGEMQSLCHIAERLQGLCTASEIDDEFKRLAKYFDNNGKEGITSYELLKSNTVPALLGMFDLQSLQNGVATDDIKRSFASHFKTSNIQGNATSTPFMSLVHKLQDLLSRTEHFDVITVHQNPYEHSRSTATSVLAKQLRLKLCADEDSEIPKQFRSIMVSIHAIATFKSLDDYLRPRIAMMQSSSSSLSKSPATFATAPDVPTSATRTQSGTNLSASDDPAVKTKKTHIAVTDSKSAAATSSSTSHQPELPTLTGYKRLRDLIKNEMADDGSGSQVECADETRISDEENDNDEDHDDQEEDDMNDDMAGETSIFDDLQDVIDDQVEEADAEPQPVNLEVANSGKVIARKEDGTRIATPQQKPVDTSSYTAESRAARLAAARDLLSSPSALRRHLSYASALLTTPTDWHLQFSINGQPVSSDTTIYRAVHFNQATPDEVSGRAMWSATHQIMFKKVSGPAPSESSSISPLADLSSPSPSSVPVSLRDHPTTAAILKLLKILGEIGDTFSASLTTPDSPHSHVKTPSLFINNKLTAKLNRQLEEPLIVASNCLPNWAEDLAKLYPFLFPFECRYLYLQSTSFGYSRSMSRWQSNQSENESRRHRDERPFLGRTQRQKVRISRNRILESALKVTELYGSSPSMLEIEYFDEVGTGLGPTLEFYATISKEFSRKKLKLWRENESTKASEYVFGINGLFPAPMSSKQLEDENGKRTLEIFRLLGKFIARSMLDSRIIDIPFNPVFFRIANNLNAKPSLNMIALVDGGLAKSMSGIAKVVEKKKRIHEDANVSTNEKFAAYDQIRINGVAVEELGLDFTLPGYPSIELCSHGANIDVTIDNVDKYYAAVLEFTVGNGVKKQIESFKTGFSQVFPYSALQAFTPEELVMLFGRSEEDWSLESASLINHTYMIYVTNL